MNWDSIVGKVIDGASTVIAAKIDKPLSNIAQVQPTNQLTAAKANAQVSDRSELGISAPASPYGKYLPTILIGGVIIVGVFFLFGSEKRF